mmetsp:Transcript_42197/g.99004  ORF Transcript_42197/g.99004 Transcript_42197/m.99004 type:complete len:243 (+) Transcript_42197:2683-3411(+)
MWRWRAKDLVIALESVELRSQRFETATSFILASKLLQGRFAEDDVAAGIPHSIFPANSCHCILWNRFFAGGLPRHEPQVVIVALLQNRIQLLIDTAGLREDVKSPLSADRLELHLRLELFGNPQRPFRKLHRRQRRFGRQRCTIVDVSEPDTRCIFERFVRGSLGCESSPIALPCHPHLFPSFCGCPICYPSGLSGSHHIDVRSISPQVRHSDFVGVRSLSGSLTPLVDCRRISNIGTGCRH